MSLDVITFGCRLNAYESEVVKRQAAIAGLDDAVIVNTCAVTAEAVRQARQAIRKARRQRPDAQLIVTGCAAQIESEAFAAMPEVDRVLGNLEKLDWRHLGADDGARIEVNDIMAAREVAGHLIEGYDGRSRAFVQVQQGCDHRCTFCIIPFARGNSRSVPIGAIVDQVRRLVRNGYREVVLTGVDITAYGADLPGAPGLGQMVRRLLRLVPGLPRLRLSSIDPAEVDPDLMALIAGEPRLMPHLHLSLQAGDDMILKRMKRRHSRQQAVDFCQAVRRARPGVVFGADLIAGFPTETDAMFQQSLDLIDDCDLIHLHVFAYSEREGTPAARMPAVAKAVRKERAARLRAKGRETLDRHLHGQLGAASRVLIEGADRGRTESFLPVVLDDGHAEPGDIIAIEAIAVRDGMLVGRPVS